MFNKPGNRATPPLKSGHNKLSLIFTCGSKYLILWLLYGPENFMFESGEA
jgi:hypothetical protein